MTDITEYSDSAPGDAYLGNRKFHGVYLLVCQNPAYKGKTYIGYTVNPKRRIKQHNTGKQAGGAWKTSGRGPWEMVLIIHGFPSDVAGLRFEWAWQNPSSSRRLKHLSRKTKNETLFEFNLRIMSEMLRTGPWNRLPLTIQWLKQEFAVPLPVRTPPPIHMPLAYGQISVQDCKPTTDKPEKIELSDSQLEKCQICESDKTITDRFVECCYAGCDFTSHIACLANHAREASSSKSLVPISVKCPSCNLEALWGDIVYGKKAEPQDMEGEYSEVSEEM